jgi:quercetin dioxygenase-like cupin family protein
VNSKYAPIDLNGMQVRFLLDAADTGGAATVFEVDVPAGGMAPPPHSHDGFDETVYGLTGTVTYTVDGEVTEVKPGTALYVGKGQVHKFENLGDVDATMLSVASPGVFRPAYFEDIAAVLAASPGGPPDKAAMASVMVRHGLTPVAPPAPAQI